jgi:hypothetical protein
VVADDRKIPLDRLRQLADQARVVLRNMLGCALYGFEDSVIVGIYTVGEALENGIEPVALEEIIPDLAGSFF